MKSVKGIIHVDSETFTWRDAHAVKVKRGKAAERNKLYVQAKELEETLTHLIVANSRYDTTTKAKTAEIKTKVKELEVQLKECLIFN